MSPRSLRELLEAELRAPEVAAVREWCAVWETDPGTWPDAPRLGVFVDLAVGRFLGRLPSIWSSRRRLRVASDHFGLHAGSLRKRYQRAGVVPGERQVTPSGVVDLRAEREASLARQQRAG